MKAAKIIIAAVVIIIVVLLKLHQISQDREAPKYVYTKSQMKTIKSAIHTYIAETGRLPSRLDDLVLCPAGLEDIWSGPYLKESQINDPWKNKYILEYGYRLKSFGANGIKGGVDENADIESFTGLVKYEN